MNPKITIRDIDFNKTSTVNYKKEQASKNH